MNQIDTVEAYPGHSRDSYDDEESHEEEKHFNLEEETRFEI